MSVASIERSRAGTRRTAEAVPGGDRGRRRAPVRLTARGRALVLAVLVALALMVGSIAVATTGGSPSSRSALPTTVVEQGDTLWGIATRHAPDRDPLLTMDEIRRLNGIKGSTIEVGQELVLPAR